MKKKILLIVTLCCVYFSYGQKFGESKFLDVSSPNATEYKRYGNYPVDLAHGAVNISIPIYQLHVGSVTVPINLSYHTGGIRTNEMPSWTGVGWNLNSGGVITRSVKGLPDDHLISPDYFGGHINIKDLPILCNRTGYFWTSISRGGVREHLNKLTDLSSYRYEILAFQIGGIDPVKNKLRYRAASETTAAYLREKEKDYVSDEYCYNFNGVAGKFYFNSIKGSNDKDSVEIITHPHREWKIKITAFDKYGRFSGFQVTTENGVKYLFGSNDTSSKNKEYFSSETYTGINSWYLSEIIPVDSPNTIKFNYTSHCEEGESIFQIDDFRGSYYVANNIPYSAKYVEYDTDTEGFPDKIDDVVPSNYSTTNSHNLNILHNIYLESIETVNQIISFHRSPVISNLFTNGAFNVGWGNIGHFAWNTSKHVSVFCDNNEERKQKLTKITIKDKINNLDKRNIVFTYDDKETQRWFLSSVKEGNQTYHFSYIPGLPVQKKKGHYFNIQTDHWGFYNAFPPSFASMNVPYVFGKYGCNRDVNTNYITSGVLKEIRYPTGGKTKFQYEANRYCKVKYNKKKKHHSGSPEIINLDFDFSLEIKETTYFYCRYRANTYCLILQPGSYKRSYFLDQTVNFRNRISLGYDSYLYYSMDSRSIPFENFLYYYKSESNSAAYGPSVRIKNIKKYSFNGELIGKTEYEYLLDDSSSSGVVLEEPRYLEKILKYDENVLCLNSWEPINGNTHELIYTRVVEKQLGNGKTVYHYKDDTESSKVKNTVPFLSAGLSSIKSGRFGFLPYETRDLQVYMNSWGKLKSKEIFNEKNELLKKIDYSYSTECRKGTLLISKNSSFVHKFFEDYFVRNWYFKEDLLNSEIVTNYYKGNKVVSKRTIQRHPKYYSLIASEKTYVNDQVQTKIYKYPVDYDLSKIENQTTVLQEMLESNYIGLPVEIQNIRNGKLTTAILNEYFIDHNKVRLNKMYSYENVDLIDVGNLNTNINEKYDKWNHSPNQFKLKNELFYENGLLASIRSNKKQQTYLWGYNNNNLIAKISNIGNQNLQNIKKTIGVYNNELSASQNLKLRSGLPNSQVETYRYDPVYGLIEVIDVNNLSTYYEYDNLGRLVTIRDKDLNIIKKHTYHNVVNEKLSQNYFSIKYKGIDLGGSVFIQGIYLNDEVEFDTNMDWQIIENLDWISVDKISGTGSAKIKITCTPRSDSDRVGRIIVKTENREYYLYVRQFRSKHFYYKTEQGIRNNLILCRKDFNNYTFEILSDDNLTIRSDQDWLSCSVSRENDKYKICLNTNSFQDMRVASLSITGSYTNKVVKVLQKGIGITFYCRTNSKVIRKDQFENGVQKIILERKIKEANYLDNFNMLFSGKYRVEFENCIIFDKDGMVLLNTINGSSINGRLEYFYGEGQVKFYSKETNELRYRIIIK